jgi:hypothetical protein
MDWILLRLPASSPHALKASLNGSSNTGKGITGLFDGFNMKNLCFNM